MSETAEMNGIISGEKTMARIITYKDLVEEEARLVMELDQNKARMAEDINIMKLRLQPAGQALNFMNRITGGSGKPGLVSRGTDIAIDLLTKKYLFRGSGWLATLAGSYLVRGISQLLLQKTKGRKNITPKTGSDDRAHPAADEMLNQ